VDSRPELSELTEEKIAVEDFSEHDEDDAGEHLSPAATTVQLRLPSAHTASEMKIDPNAKAATDKTLAPPPADWIKGTWHVTHSSLLAWKKCSNVRITYTPLPTANKFNSINYYSPDLDDFVQSEPDRIYNLARKVHGISSVVNVEGLASGWAYEWRGKDLKTKAAGPSKWEVLGWGEEPSKGRSSGWLVINFSKSIFTAAGIDILCRSSNGVSKATLNSIKEQLVGMESLKKNAETIFEVAKAKVEVVKAKERMSLD